MRPLILCVLSTAALWVALAGPAKAQARLDQRPGAAFALFRPAANPAPAHPVSFIHSSAPDHRWEGLAIGAIVGGMTFAVLANGLCNDPDGSGGCFIPTLGGMLLGGAAGGVAGATIGAFIPKSHSASSH